MATLSGRATLSTIDLYTSTTDQPSGLYVGALQDGLNGKLFRYALVGGVALVAGNLLQSAAEDTTYENMAVLATAIATTTPQVVNITNGTSTITSQQFEGGSVSVYTTPDLGREYTILGVTGTLTTGGALSVTVDRPLGTAWTTATKVNMKRNVFSGVIQYPTTQTGVAAGVAVFALPNATYGWVQTHGMAGVLSDASTFAVGSSVVPSLSAAGAVGVNVAGTTHQFGIGAALQAAASAHVISVFLTID